MPPLIRPNALLAPRCLACCQRLSRSLGLDETASRGLLGYQIQIRGKKKKVAPKITISVKLVEDLEGYGRKGAVVPVPIGQMRNVYYPRRIANYLTQEESQAVKENKITVQRDTAFGVKDTKRRAGGAEVFETEDVQVEQPARHPALPDTIRADLRRLSPGDAFRLLSALLPPTFTFYRAPILQPEQADSDSSRKISEQATAPPTSIYGSVSTADIVNNIRVILDSSDVKGRIELDEADVQFVELANSSEETTTDRVKQLGTFEIDIKIKSQMELIRRVINVKAESERPAPDTNADSASLSAAIGSELPIEAIPDHAPPSPQAIESMTN